MLLWSCWHATNCGTIREKEEVSFFFAVGTTAKIPPRQKKLEKGEEEKKVKNKKKRIFINSYIFHIKSD
jgi:hypothetical protein